MTGDAVNVAARLEQAAEPGDVLVGERTVAAARGAFEFGPPETVPAKGKPQGVPARRLLRAITLMRPRGVHGLRRAFVGREPEPLRRTGRCLPYGHGITYWPLGEILREHLGILDTDSGSCVGTDPCWSGLLGVFAELGFERQAAATLGASPA